MAEYDKSRFRITTWPASFDEPDRVWAPELVATGEEGDDIRYLDGSPVMGPRESLIGIPVKDGEDLVTASRRILDELGVNPADLSDPAVRSRLMAEYDVPPPQDDMVYFDWDSGSAAPLPSEFFMREFVELDNDEDLRALHRALGPLVLPQNLFEDATGVRPSIDFDRLPHPSGAVSPQHRYEVYEQLHWAMYSAPTDGHDLMISHDDRTRTLRAFDLGLQGSVLFIYQAVFSSLALLSENPDFDFAAARKSASAAVQEVWEERDLPVPRSDLDALDTVIDFVNAGASTFGPRIELASDDSSAWPVYRPAPGLLAAMSLQAIALLSSRVPVRRCRNETCHNFFARQRGRAKAGQHKATGVLYCSAECARAQAQREYRRRKRDTV